MDERTERTVRALRRLADPFIQDDSERDCGNCRYDACSCALDALNDAIALLEETEPRPARLLSFVEARTATGHGWEEVWLQADVETPEEILLFECVMINGYYRCADGDVGEAVEAYYNKQYHSRLWLGDLPPTEEQRRAAWEC